MRAAACTNLQILLSLKRAIFAFPISMDDSVLPFECTFLLNMAAKVLVCQAVRRSLNWNVFVHNTIANKIIWEYWLVPFQCFVLEAWKRRWTNYGGEVHSKTTQFPKGFNLKLETNKKKAKRTNGTKIGEKNEVLLESAVWSFRDGENSLRNF